MTNNPASILYNVSGSEIAITGGAPLTGTQPGIVIAGHDGTYVRLLKTNIDGALTTIISGSTISLSVTGTVGLDRGNSSSNPLWTSGSVTVSFPAVQTVTGTITVGNQVTVTATGSIPVVGSVSVSNFPATQVVSGTVGLDRGSSTANPIWVSGSFSTTATGVQTVTGTIAQGAPNGDAASWPMKLAGRLGSSFSPDPSNYVTNDYAQVRIDASGRLETHSAVTTDEFSFRTDFSGSSITRTLNGTVTFTNGSTTVSGSGASFTSQVIKSTYIKLSSDENTYYTLVDSVYDDDTIVLEEPYNGASATGTAVIADVKPFVDAGSSIVASGSYLTITVGTTTGTGSYIERPADYLPLSLAFVGSISQRIAGQTGSLGLRDAWDGPAQRVVEVRFHGTDSSTVEFVSSMGAAESDTQRTTGIPIPLQGVTSAEHTYKIDLSHDIATLIIDDIVSAVHTQHLPGPYDFLHVNAGIENTGTPASSTSLVINSIYFDNFNRIETRNSNKSEPDPVQVVGSTTAGITKAVGVTTTGDMHVELGGSNVSAFGDIITVGLVPIMQFDFVNQLVVSGTMTQFGGPILASGGAASSSLGRLQLSTNTNVSGAAVYVSKNIARYRAGQGITARFTTAFATPASNSVQIVGMSDANITWKNNATAPGPPITAIDVNDGYFFGYNGTTFGIRHKNARAGTDTWYAQSLWNIDRCDGSRSALNPSGFNWTQTNGNVMQIRYPYLGYGDIKFYVQNSDTGAWILCHLIKYTNSSAQVQVSNPSMYFFAQAKNTGNTSNLQMYIGSVGVFLAGVREYLGPSYGLDARINNNGANNELPIISLRNCTSFNGIPNRGIVRLRSVAFSGDGAATDVRFRIRRNPTLTGATFANAIYGTITGGSTGYIITNGQSVVAADTAASAVAAVTVGASDVVFNGVASRYTGYQVDLTPYDIFIVPGDTYTFTMTSTANNNAVQVAVNWHEDI
jgi:hypothetical protein